MRLLVLADTHVPRRAPDLPPQVWSEVDAADAVVHAGDWVEPALLDRFAERTPRLIGVYGNNDGSQLQARLPEVAYAELDGLKLAVIHETGASTGRERRCAERFGMSDVLVFGHSHIPWDTTADNGRPHGLRLLNPGSPTDRRRQPVGTYLIVEIQEGMLSRVTLKAVRPAIPAIGPRVVRPGLVRPAARAGSSRPAGTPGSA